MSTGADRVTVLVPVWGSYAGEQLEDALSSLLSQDFPARILVVDNASDVPVEVPDGVDVVRAPARLTLGGVRNLGLTHVSSPYAIVWAADDVMLPGTIGFLVARLDAASDHVAFAAGIVDGQTGERYRWPRRWTTSLLRYPRLFALLQCVWSAYPTTGATIMRSEDVQRAGGYTDSVSASDWGLGAALAFRGRLGWSERPGRIYRPRPGSVWDRHSDLGWLLEHSRTSRARLRDDPGIPRWARASLPVVAAAQYLTLFVLRPPRLLARRLRRGR
jgi:glycosyltransferase involved in cell wall biosynthesis